MVRKITRLAAAALLSVLCHVKSGAGASLTVSTSPPKMGEWLAVTLVVEGGGPGSWRARDVNGPYDPWLPELRDWISLLPILPNAEPGVFVYRPFYIPLEDGAVDLARGRDTDYLRHDFSAEAAAGALDVLIWPVPRNASKPLSFVYSTPQLGERAVSFGEFQSTVPECSSAAMALAALGVFSVLRRRRYGLSDL